MKKILLFTAILFSFVSFTGKKKWYCACCGERGQYTVSNETLDQYTSGLLSELKFMPNTELYTGNEDENLGGLKSIKAGYEANDWQAHPYYFSMNASLGNKAWKLSFKTVDGKTGTLTLPVQKKMVSFKIDIHDTPEGNEVVLYKEFRFKGTVLSGDGFFKSSLTKPATFFLLLQGRGNNCDNPEDFKNWRLEVKGPGADYTFFGKLN